MMSGLPKLSITVDLNPHDLDRLDAWIAARPEPQPSRSKAVMLLFGLGLDYGREVEITREHVAAADRDIREKFDRLTEVLKLAAANVADDGEGRKRH